ncbi:MAG TPA: Hpt domain-containing protein [Methylocystis sp.]|nr:Hpt domain-containing protein [Methylocystis sp.]
MSQIQPASKQAENRAPAAPGGLVIDLVHLSRQTLGDAALESELLRLFDHQAAGFMVRLRAETQPHEGAKCADLAHMLKGSARAVGAFALADAAERVERASRANPPENAVAALLADLELAIERTRADIAQLI